VLAGGTSGHDVERGPGNGRAAMCDSGTLSGTWVDEERRRKVRAPRKPDAIHSPKAPSNCGPSSDNPRRTATLRQSKHVPLQAAGHLVTIAGCSGRWNPRADGQRHEQPFGDLLPRRHAARSRSAINTGRGLTIQSRRSGVRCEHERRRFLSLITGSSARSFLVASLGKPGATSRPGQRRRGAGHGLAGRATGRGPVGGMMT